MKLETKEDMTTLELTEDEVYLYMNCFITLTHNHGELKKGTQCRVEWLLIEIEDLQDKVNELYDVINKRG